MQRALLVAVLVGAVCAVLSCYLVLKGWSLMGDAISHAVLPGIVLAFVLGLPLAVGAFAAGLGCAVATGYLKENSRVKEDTVMGIVFSGMFGFGLVLFTKVETDQHLNSHPVRQHAGRHGARPDRDRHRRRRHAAGRPRQAPRPAALLLRSAARARHRPAACALLHYGLLVLLSLTIVASLKAVGIILVVAMLVAPGAIAYLLTNRFERMLVIAAAVAIGSSVAGTLVSFHIDGATGPCIVLIQAGVFVLALLFAPQRGLLRRRRAATARGWSRHPAPAIGRPPLRPSPARSSWQAPGAPAAVEVPPKRHKHAKTFPSRCRHREW